MARMRVSTTVVALVSSSDDRMAEAAAANVAVGRIDADLPPNERARSAWRAAKQASRTYFLHDADPLADLAAAWIGFFDGDAGHGSIEVARERVLAQWRSDEIALPDYYLIDAPEELPATSRHWYLGLLARSAPSRVIASSPNRSISDQLGSLPTGRWWPPLDEMLRGIERTVPDHVPVRAGGDPVVLARP